MSGLEQRNEIESNSQRQYYPIYRALCVRANGMEYLTRVVGCVCVVIRILLDTGGLPLDNDKWSALWLHVLMVMIIIENSICCPTTKRLSFRNMIGSGLIGLEGEVRLVYFTAVQHFYIKL